MNGLKVMPKDLYEYRFPHDVNCSPDGAYTAFLLTRMDEQTNSYRHDICLLEPSNGSLTELTQTGDVGSFAWMSSKEIIFQSARKGQKKGTADIFRISVSGGEASKMFTIPAAAAVPVPLGNGKWLIQTRKATDPKETVTDRAAEGIDYWTFTDAPFLRNGEDFSERKRTSLGIFDEADGSVNYITEKYFETAGYDITADQKHIIYYGEEYTDYAGSYHSLLSYDIEAGKTTELIAGGTYQISLVKCTAGGNIFLQASLLDRQVTQNHDLYLLRKKDGQYGKPEKILSPKGMYTTLIDVDAVYGGGRSAKIQGENFIGYWLNRSKTEIDEINTDNGDLRAITQVDAMTSFDLTGEYLYASAADDGAMAEIWQIHMTTGEKRKLTSFSDEYLASHRISKPEKFSFLAKNQEEVDGFVIPPADFDQDKKYPGVLFIHGGPKWASGEAFMHLYQCVASQGMFVFYCNPHGSDGYGEAFLDMVKEWGQVDYSQIMEFTDECLKRYPNLDAGRLGVSGGSYGGYMTNWIIGHTDRFRAAVSQRGISNLVTLALLSDLGERVIKQSCGECTPWNQEEVLWEQSPLKYAKNVTAPTLFLHSDKDFRCFMGESFQMFTALKQNGVETQMYLFHGEHHGLSRSGGPKHRIVRVEAILEWFEKYL